MLLNASYHLFYSWIIFHDIDVQHFLSSFICWRILRLYLLLAIKTLVSTHVHGRIYLLILYIYIYISRSGIVGMMIMLYSAIWVSSRMFSKLAAPLYIHFSSVWEYFTSLTTVKVCQGFNKKKKYHRLGALSSSSLFSHNSGGWTSKIMVLAGFFSCGFLFLACWCPPSCFHFTWLASLYTHALGVSQTVMCILIFFSYKNSSHVGVVTTLTATV